MQITKSSHYHLHRLAIYNSLPLPQFTMLLSFCLQKLSASISHCGKWFNYKPTKKHVSYNLHYSEIGKKGAEWIVTALISDFDSIVIVISDCVLWISPGINLKIVEGNGIPSSDIVRKCILNNDLCMRKYM